MKSATTMGIGWKSACALLALGLLLICGIAGQGWINPALAGKGQENANGAAGQMPAYYEGDLFTINFSSWHIIRGQARPQGFGEYEKPCREGDRYEHPGKRGVNTCAACLRKN